MPAESTCFELVPSEQLSQNEIDAARLVSPGLDNVQQQHRIVWPSSPVVARAYLDQLTRTKGIAPARAEAVKAALDGGVAGADLDGLATSLEHDSGTADGLDARRLHSLATTMKGLSKN